MNDAEVITAIKAHHLRANVSWLEQAGGTLDWDRAVLDPGGTIFGPGPYAKVPTTMDDAWIRVYPPERLRKRLAQGLLNEWLRVQVHGRLNHPDHPGCGCPSPLVRAAVLADDAELRG